MPAMPRPHGKGRKIAWSILGKPANLQPQPVSKKEKKIRRVLFNQETAYSR